MFTIDEDDAGVMMIVAQGCWDEGELRRYWSHVEATVGDQRRRHRHVKVVIDTSEGPATSPEDADASFARWSRLLSSPADRLAIVLPSSLAKIRMKTAFEDERYQLFVSRSAAHTWVCAYG